MADVGTGTTIVFGTSGFTASVLNVNGSDISRPDIDITSMASTNYREFMPGDLVDGGAVEVEILFDPDEQPPIADAAETITITFPIPSGLTNGATLAFSGYCNSWSWGVPLEDRMTANATLKVDGKGSEPAWTDAS